MPSANRFKIVLAVCCAAMIGIAAMPPLDFGVAARSGYIVASS
jgi:hypothetical protein